MTVETPKFRFSLLDEIYWKWRTNETLFCIIEGELGAGKSSVAIQMLIDIYGPEKWKKYLVFKPEDFLNLVNELIESGERVPLIVWDDAGLWLYAMDWSDERVKSVVKFLNVVRTVAGGIVFTTPTMDMLVGKIPLMPGMRVATVTREGMGNGSARGASHDRRKFIVARTIKTRWGKKWVRDYIEDDFNVRLPEDIYGYYQPLRDKYAEEANAMMREAWKARLNVSKLDRSMANSPK